MDLEEALGTFDTVDANLRRLEKTWNEMVDLIPKGIAFISGSPEARRYDELSRGFNRIKAGLPAIDGWRIESVPWQLSAIAQNRLDAQDVGEIQFIVETEEGISQPGREIDEYRSRLEAARRGLVRDRAITLIRTVDLLLPGLVDRSPDGGQKIIDPDWTKLTAAVLELERVAGSVVVGTSRWKDLRRHVGWGQGQDLKDIVSLDWPSVRRAIEQGLYSDLESLPVEVADLSTIVNAKPTGPVTTKLGWKALDAEGFERLLYNILSDADDYDNLQWLFHTNAPDKGRDLSARHRVTDSLSGTSYERVIIQAKHWLTQSIRPKHVSETLTAIQLWEPPPIHVLVVATSGRFTADAVTWVEKHNLAGKRPRVEMWASSHLESLLATRRDLVAEFKLHNV